MNTNPTSTFHRIAGLGACVLVGAAALTACGRDSQVTAGPGIASASAPVAAYVSPEQADRAAIFAVRAEHASADRPAPKVAPKAYVSPEQADRAAIFAARADALARQHDLDLGTALARKAAAEKTSAHASADALERHAAVEQSTTSGSADALEHWALADSDS